MIRSSSLGFSRLGKNHEYSNAITSFLNGTMEEQKFFQTGANIRKYNLSLHLNAGIDIIPSNDFSWHDHVWDTSVILGNIPKRYYWEGGMVPNDIYFAANIGHKKDKFEVHGMEHLPWFNTKYYYTVPEFYELSDFEYSDNKAINHFIEAKNIIQNSNHPSLTRLNQPRTVLLGPMTYIILGKQKSDDDNEADTFDKFDFIHDILKVYEKIFSNLKRIGATHIQIDEPCLSLDLTKVEQELYRMSYNKIRAYASEMNIMLTTGHGDIGNNSELIFSLPVDIVHLNLKSEFDNFESCAPYIKNKSLSLGIVAGDNVFINNIKDSLVKIDKIINVAQSENIEISGSTSFLYCPVDINLEVNMPQDVKQYLVYGKQKLEEISIITRKIIGQSTAEDDKYIANNTKLYKGLVEFNTKLTPVNIPQYKRNGKNSRIHDQRKNFNITTFPLTTIGSFSKVKAIDTPKKKKDDNASVSTNKVNDCINKQDSMGFDILSCGEFHRNSSDFEYFTSFMDGNIYNTDHGFIQTMGQNIEKPSVILGSFRLKNDISEIFNYLKNIKGISSKPIKFRIIGAITALSRSFVSPELDFAGVISTISHSLRKIIEEGVNKGINVIQIDEHNIREKMPLRLSNLTPKLSGLDIYIKNLYTNLDPSVQIQMHIAKSRISDYVEDLEGLDLDVLLIDGSRTGFDILEYFAGHKYQKDIGVGLCDLNSVYTPSDIEIRNIIQKMIRIFDVEKIWITYDSNPVQDYGNIQKAFTNIYNAVIKVREKYE